LIGIFLVAIALLVIFPRLPNHVYQGCLDLWNPRAFEVAVETGAYAPLPQLPQLPGKATAASSAGVRDAGRPNDRRESGPQLRKYVSLSMANVAGQELSDIGLEWQGEGVIRITRSAGVKLDKYAQHYELGDVTVGERLAVELWVEPAADLDKPLTLTHPRGRQKVALKARSSGRLFNVVCIAALIVLCLSYEGRLKSLLAAFKKAIRKHDYLDEQCNIIVSCACVTNQFWQVIAASTDFEAACTSLIKSSETDAEKRRRLEQLGRDAENLRSEFDEVYREAQRVTEALHALEEPLDTSGQIKKNAERLKEQVQRQLETAAGLKDFLTQAVDRKYRDTLAKFVPPEFR
jgi:hypothetical protein